MKKLFFLSASSLLAFAAHSHALTNLSLASAMNGGSFLADYDITGSQAQINFGNGAAGDADGLYNVSNLSQSFGSVNVFPNEGSFVIGSLAYDESLLTGTGMETIAISSLNLNLSTDIPATGLDLWFSGPASFSFGALDAADQLTFTNGVLTSIDLSVTSAFSVNYFSATTATVYSGAFSIAGSALNLAIDDTETQVNFNFGTAASARFQSSLTGNVSVVPEPSTWLLLGGGLIAGCLRWQRRNQHAA